MKSSVCLPARNGRKEYFDLMKSSGSHVAAVYRSLVNSSWVDCEGMWIEERSEEVVHEVVSLS